MMTTLKFLLRSKIKYAKVVHPASGFTLIELLIGMVMAFLIITPLLGFMITVLNTDRQEGAKANSEQEIQAALDYIARDLKQAVYIYDATGIDAIKNQLPSTPTGIDRVPVLVFWKRELVPNVVANSGSTTTKDDIFVYSLVSYYLTKDTSTSTTWSKAARISRWQIKDGVTTRSTDSAGVTCTGYTGKYVSGNCPSPGFAPFDLNKQGTLAERMNAWTKETAAYTADAVVLVDYIDQTTTTQNSNLPPLSNNFCPDTTTWSKVPPTSFNTQDTGKMTGFYACIDRINTTGQVFIRGNARARIDSQANNITYNSTQTTYFPTMNVRVQGRGYLYK